MIFLGESTGARMPDAMGARNMGAADNPTQYMRKRETPWVSAVLGHCFGSSAWYTAMADFVVMRKGSILAVSSPRLISMATREAIDPESLGGWNVHAEITGLADLVVETDEEALDAVKKFLGYLPSHCNETAPRMQVPPGSGGEIQNLLELIPESPNRAYDIKEIIETIVDKDSLFELKELFAQNVVTALARIDGRSVGIVANNPVSKGGAIDADACDKVINLIVLCDSFNIPIIFMVDQPGFLIGAEAEKKRMPGKIMNWMNAVSLCTVPKISLILRKDYGQAFLNMGGGGNANEVAAWWTAQVGFMDPVLGATIVYGVNAKDDPERFQQCLAAMKRDTSAYDIGAIYGTHAVIDPRETREYLTRMLEIYQMRMTKGVGEHLMRTWPTTY
jgi:acetyl-CoA carboxylase carboxyltransferase component